MRNSTGQPIRVAITGLNYPRQLVERELGTGLGADGAKIKYKVAYEYGKPKTMYDELHVQHKSKAFWMGKGHQKGANITATSLDGLTEFFCNVQVPGGQRVEVIPNPYWPKFEKVSELNRVHMIAA